MEFYLAFRYSGYQMNSEWRNQFLSTLLLSIICLSFWLSPLAKASEKVYLPVGKARTKKTVLAFPEIRLKNSIGLPKSSTLSSLSKTLSETILKDLNFMDLFRFLESSAFIENPSQGGMTLDQFKLSDWTTLGVEFLIKSEVSMDTHQNLIFEVHLYDTFGAKQVLAKRYLASMQEVKAIAHSFANDVVQTLTGIPGIFQTKIAMSCDHSGKKEIYMMNYDGTEVKQITHHRSIAFAPAWSPDGSRIAYSLFTRHSNNIKNIDLYEFNFTTNTVRMLSGRQGINSGAAYSPDGKSIAMTLSYLGNPEIFLLNLDSKSLVKMTKSFGFDVDPAWDTSGKKMAFVSSRTGMPMIFTMNVEDKSVQRLTYAGRYNATPTWSSQKNKIGFAGWIDKSFDIFIMNADGTNIERITKNQGNNEDPFFSPDGNFLVFSSNRTGQKNIYLMNIDGTFVKRLTYGLGNCVSPKWSNPPVANISNVQH